MPALRSTGIVLLLTTTFAACTTYFETPTSSSTPTVSPDPNTFASRIGPGGSAARSLSLSAAGTIQASLTSAAPPVLLGLGIGIPRSDGGGCDLTRSVETLPGDGARIEIGADPGMYCVKIFDLGLVQDTVSFSVTIAHP